MAKKSNQTNVQHFNFSLNGTVVNDVSRVKEGDMLKVYVRNGLIEAKVTDISIYEE